MNTFKITNKKQQTLYKLTQLHWSIIVIILTIVSIGLLMQYSAARGNVHPWVNKQIFHCLIGLFVLFCIALTNIKFWLRYSYLIYFCTLGSLLAVEILGSTAMGAQRWIDLYFINFQPSELMKISLVLALARYFHYLSIKETNQIRYFIIPTLLIIMPVLLVLKQPDLGTAAILTSVGVTIIFLAGINKFVLIGSFIVGLVSLPIFWSFLHTYQKNRLFTFLNPERDPLGSGYHILQSKIALGSGGLFGKGFLNGSQSYLNFLPEKQTDFIFTMFSEEFGMLGGIILLILYILLLLYCYSICWKSKTQYGRLLTLGITVTVFLYFFINMAMVMGLVPVVGVPLPLVSYGGASLLTIMSGFGFIMSVSIHNNFRCKS